MGHWATVVVAACAGVTSMRTGAAAATEPSKTLVHLRMFTEPPCPSWEKLLETRQPGGG
jgi:hypothetical protein